MTVINMDCRMGMSMFPDNHFDSIVCDPPYELGFMGKAWDATGIANSVEMWREALRVLKPGGHLLAFSGSRTYHRMTCAIEDAGFEVRDQIMWVYGSGFPKSQNVSLALDKKAGAVGHLAKSFNMKGGGERSAEFDGNGRDLSIKHSAITDAARQWEGWGTALKPAHEPICVARKPLASLAANVLDMIESQLRAQGVTGDITWKQENVNGATKSKRKNNSDLTQPSEPSETSVENAAGSGMQSGAPLTPNSSVQPGANGQAKTPPDSESYHAKLIDDFARQSSKPMAKIAPAAASLSQTSSPSTTSTAGAPLTEKKSTEKSTPNCDAPDTLQATESYAGIATGLPGSMATVHITRDETGAFLWPKGLPKFVPGGPLTVAANVLAHGTGALNIDGCRVGTEGGTSRGANGSNAGKERNVLHGGNFGIEQLDAGRWPANLIHDGSDEVLAAFPDAKGQQGATAARSQGEVYGTVNAGQVGIEPRNDAGSAARFFYCAKTSKADRGAENVHPTVKPTDLMRYLCRLVTPPGGKVLDHFAGSGSTGKACKLEGFEFVGFEMSAEYAEIANRRIEDA